MAERFEQVYSQEQRDALASAYEDRRVRPARRVVELAETGELAPGLPAFKVHGGVNTVRDFARKLRVKRSGEHSSALAKQPPRDAIEQLRRRLVTVADEELAALEKIKAGTRDVDKIRQLGRAIREAAAIPGPTDPTPLRPGHAKDPNTGKQTTEGTTRGGIAGGVLAQAHRAAINAPTGTTATDDPREQQAHTDNANAAHDHAATSEAINATENTSPGEWARAEIAARLGGGENARLGSG